MAIWLNRAGSHGEFEQKFIQDKRIYATWDRLVTNLQQLPDKKALFDVLEEIHPDDKPKRLHNWVSQLWPFAHEMKKGDIVFLPLKTQPAFYIGEITGDYHFDPKGPNPFYHWRPVKWIGEAIPRSHFGQDILYTLGAFLTICRIRQHNAESRILKMRSNSWKLENLATTEISNADLGIEESVESVNLEELAQDQITQLIAAKFKGHNLTRLVEAILKAQGYTTYRSPAGPDGGIDIIAGTGALGFGMPRLCVQVKSQDTPVEAKTVNELRGVMQKVQAHEGLFVSWGGFKSSVNKEIASLFFSVRLWTKKEVLEQLFMHYDKLDEDLKAELPLKRIWTVATQEEES